MSQQVVASQQIEWDQTVLDKYNYSGPRYTSYPTALEFHEAFTAADFDMACTSFPDRPLSLYVHIPFCHKLCYYCGCNKVITRHSHKADEYLDALACFKSDVSLNCILVVVHQPSYQKLKLVV